MTAARTLLATLALALLLAATPAYACSCVLTGSEPTVQELTVYGLVVFVGEAREIRAKDPTGDPKVDEHFLRGTVTAFRVERSWNDVLPEETPVESGFPGAGCGWLFEASKRYLVFATRRKDGTLETNICTRTTLVERAPELRERVVQILGRGLEPGDCPNPLLESVIWHSIEGMATEVTGARTFTFAAEDGRTVSVTLANLGASSAPEAADVLRRLVRHKQVSVLVRPASFKDSEVVGEVRAGATDVARELLRAGLVAFEPARSYALSAYSECLNRNAEEEAKRERRGIWASTP